MVVPILNCILDANEPEDINDFVMHLEACINTEGDKGADCFSFRMMTSKRLERISKEIGPMLLRAVFIVNGASMEENMTYVTNEINTLLLGCARNTWEETALAINYFLNWEYYDPKKGICDFYKISRNLIE